MQIKIMKIAPKLPLSVPTTQLIRKPEKGTQTDSLAPPLPSIESKPILSYYCHEPF